MAVGGRLYLDPGDIVESLRLTPGHGYPPLYEVFPLSRSQ